MPKTEDKPHSKVNRGEWSELYVLLKLLADGKMYGANEKGEQVKDSIYPILAINHKTMSGEDIYYEIVENSKIKIILNGLEIEHQAQQDKISVIARDLLNAIKNTKGPSFEVPHVSDKLGILMFPKIKASSDKKQDISIIIDNIRASEKEKIAFSIKSQLGSPSTLLNAGEGTNFLFKITGLEKQEQSFVDRLEGKTNKGLIKALVESGCEIEFMEMCDNNFEHNINLVDRDLKHMLILLLDIYYKSGKAKVKDLMEVLINKNSLKFKGEEAKDFYPHKMKRFLIDVALGMTPSSLWKGQYDANGGYIIVKKDGELVCQHIYDWNAFEDYLYMNTKFDGPSPDKHGCGKLYQENGEYFVKLGLQIRFIK